VGEGWTVAAANGLVSLEVEVAEVGAGMMAGEERSRAEEEATRRFEAAAEVGCIVAAEAAADTVEEDDRTVEKVDRSYSGGSLLISKDQ